jgi:hypothetical protein
MLSSSQMALLFNVDFRAAIQHSSIISPVNITFIMPKKFLITSSLQALLSPIFHVKQFDGDDRRNNRGAFYNHLLKMKFIAAQKLLVTYTRSDLVQPRATNWYELHWTGSHGRYCLAHAGWASPLTGET